MQLIYSSKSKNPWRKTALEKYFAQCYIDANIKECDLDLTTPERWKAFLNYADKGRLIGSKIKDGKIYQFLRNQLRQSAEAAKYNNGDYYKIP